MPFLKHCTLASALVIISGLAQATTPTVTYEFTESFVGDVVYKFTLPLPYTRRDTLTLAAGGSNLPSALQSETQQTLTLFYEFYAPTPGVEHTYCYNDGGCALSGGNANGSYTALYWVDYYERTGIQGENWIGERYDFGGTFTFTGGTGVFAGITGGGTFTGQETYSPEVEQVISKTTQGSFSLPVPEPETWGMMAAGLALVAGMARRTRQSPARLA
ncbi:PEP-CTERM sorting domain-containing protein [Methyloversatilis sp. XJ19-13]|uniref:PEP-CTERM sorting domain-containing protein n=1 Tax=Methyloversatilis sp. XJ19-13 TaxID=2963430 RepID=UPI00211C748D|nr:PEP-CTERM sorting domain-containing protein [Methyloversatilis sp. XJ19-13]MCQ9375488.1 PEP-CTERM sorting domain-containing protein [Methyloversatilis sp. XJ19-13]